MAVTIGALLQLDRQPPGWPELERSVRASAWQRPGGFHVPVGPGVAFTGWRGAPDPAAILPSAASPTVPGSCSYSVGPRVSVLCDARIDSPLALGPQLGLGPTGSPAELLAEAYLVWGDRLPERLYGDFAAIIWDAAEGTLHLVRDHVGTKPLYFVHRPGRWVSVSSDVGFLLDHGAANREVDDVALARVAAGTFADDHRTSFTQVDRVPSATIVSWSAGRPLRSRRYWRLDRRHRAHLDTRRDHLDAFEEVLTRAVTRRLGPDPAGANVGDGLGPTAIATIAAGRLAASGRRLVTGSPVLRHVDAADQPWIGTPDPLDVLADGRLLGRPDDALTGRPPSPPYGPGPAMVRRSMAERGVHTVLSDWGADEVVTASVSVANLVWDHRWRSAYRTARGGTAPGVRALVEALVPFRAPGRRRPEQPGPLDLPTADADAERWLCRLGVAPRFARLVVDVRQADDHPRRDHRTHMRRNLEDGHLQRQIEEWAEADRRHGIERAYPLLDRELLELVVSMPADQLRHHGRDRSLVRDVLDGRPNGAVDRPTDTIDIRSGRPERGRRWAATSEALGREWARSDLVRAHLDPGRLLAGLEDVIAPANRLGSPDVRLATGPALVRLMAVATFLASVDRTSTADLTDATPATPARSEDQLSTDAR